MAQVAGAPPLPPPPGMGPPPQQRPAADPARQQQHQRQHHHQQQQRQQQPHQHRPRPAGGSGSARPPSKGRPGAAAAPAAAAAPPGAAVPAIAADGTAELERLRRDTPFICSLRFKNDLPEIPADPKLLVSRFEPDRLSRFFVTSIEQQPRRELLLPADAGVTISLLDLERYDQPDAAPGQPSQQRRRLDPADEALLADVDSLPSAGGGAASPLRVKRATRGQGPTWLMATTYLTSSAENPTSAAPRGGRFAMASAAPAELTREQQLADIEATFTAAAGAPRHPTKPGLTAVSVVPIFPDFAGWEDKYVTLNFETGDPGQDSATLAQIRDPASRASFVSRCMIKSYQPTSAAGGDPAMGLLVPRAAAAAAAAGEPLPDGADVAELEGDYSWDCEYAFELQNKQPDTLLLLMHDDHVGYCQLDGNVRLRKRARQDGDEPRPEKARIHHRDYKPAELQERAIRQAELEAYEPGGEDEGVEDGGAPLDEEDY
ncbi:VIP2 [Scenedesmus sp. PABB004]|nr:VIP2 [Scenedesmus sp. PABB004]